MVSKPQIRSKGKARVDEKAQHTWEYVSILKRLATQPLGLRWGFETASKNDRQQPGHCAIAGNFGNDHSYRYGSGI